MAPFRRWADLPPDLLCRIGDRLDLKCYASARGACTAWRSALAPPSPALLVLSDARLCPSAASLPTRRSFDLAAILTGARCVGSSNGWLALSIAIYSGQSVFVLFNPVTSTEIILPSLIYESRWVSKVVFSPNPAKDDFAAVAICDIDRIAYVTAGARRWAVLDPVRLVSGDQLADVVYHDKGKVYCLTRCGDVLLLRLPERRRRKPINDEPGPSEPEAPIPIAECALGLRGRRSQYHHQRNLHMICYEHLRQRDPTGPLKLTFCSETFIPYRRLSIGPLEPDLNAPAMVEPLLPDSNLPFNPATSFAPPYNTVSAFTNAKSIVLCEGNLYQIWRNASCTVTLQLPGGGHHRVLENEILVLRYYPRRQPCWDAVTDLGGYSVFVGRNNAVSMYAEGVPGLKGNCVYWIGGRGRDQGMVFDMETGRSIPCLPSVGGIPGALQSTICWYFLSDIVNSSNNSGGRRFYQTRSRSRAERSQDMEE
ncbi:hypothetical protein GUJ93_ZPchr0014g46612 [Zizania palustris]|uniref:KIB1-4 beta-propeller domain-containing protein n=1 Tax=Zizania palustris TaxID=103762 RepID=A0A8J5TFZ2_ZIZPA|nr:hypothetical protein GUJ93_ZPchr0014g46612 [Zizania palustris]